MGNFMTTTTDATSTQASQTIEPLKLNELKKIGKQPNVKICETKPLYMAVLSKEMVDENKPKFLFIQQEKVCDNCYFASPSKREYSPFPCENCEYCELPITNSNSSLTPEENIASRKVNIEKFIDFQVQVYRIEPFEYNLNHSQFILLPMSKTDSITKEVSYDVMIYQEDYHGNLHELVVRPMGFDTLYEHQECSLSDANLYNVKEKTSFKFEEIVTNYEIFLEQHQDTFPKGTCPRFYNSIHD
jgi:hypothetical protein